MVRIIGTNKKQLLHCMRMRQFTSCQALPDLRIPPEDWKLDLELSLNHDDFYDRAWECGYGKLFFDADNDNATPPSSRKAAVQSDSSTEEIRNTPGIARKCSREIFPQIEDLCDLTDTYPYMELDAETSSEQPNKSLTNPCSSKYILRQNPNSNRHEKKRFQLLW